MFIKAMDTFWYCQKTIFSFVVSQHMHIKINNKSGKIRTQLVIEVAENVRKTLLVHTFNLRALKCLRRASDLLSEKLPLS